jgi:hypothetical protein
MNSRIFIIDTNVLVAGLITSRFDKPHGTDSGCHAYRQPDLSSFSGDLA